jgi:hypothetical protein
VNFSGWAPFFLVFKRSSYLLDSYCCIVSIHMCLPMQDGFGGSICNLKEMSHSHIVFQHDKSGFNHKETLRECSSNTYLVLQEMEQWKICPRYNLVETLFSKYY